MKIKQFKLYVGFVILFTVCFLIILYLVHEDFSIQMNLDHRLESMSAQFPFGTDDLGRDVISAVIYGIFSSLIVGFLVIILSMSIGVFLGLLAGFIGGILDSLIMRIVDIIISLPGILIVIIFISFLKPNFFSLIGILTFSNWVYYTRMVRGEALKYWKMDFIIASKGYNASSFRIIFFHLLPIISPLIIIQSFAGIGEVILVESSLNFLGIGLGPEIPTLGQMIGAGRFHLFDRPHLALVPGAALFLLVLAFNFIAEGLNDLFNREIK